VSQSQEYSLLKSGDKPEKGQLPPLEAEIWGQTRKRATSAVGSRHQRTVSEYVAVEICVYVYE
jgi:hypothetical protein